MIWIHIFLKKLLLFKDMDYQMIIYLQNKMNLWYSLREHDINLDLLKNPNRVEYLKFIYILLYHSCSFLILF